MWPKMTAFICSNGEISRHFINKKSLAYNAIIDIQVTVFKLDEGFYDVPVLKSVTWGNER